jgi:hypothetical protein
MLRYRCGFVATIRSSCLSKRDHLTIWMPGRLVDRQILKQLFQFQIRNSQIRKSVDLNASYPYIHMEIFGFSLERLPK